MNERQGYHFPPFLLFSLPCSLHSPPGCHPPSASVSAAHSHLSIISSWRAEVAFTELRCTQLSVESVSSTSGLLTLKNPE